MKKLIILVAVVGIAAVGYATRNGASCPVRSAWRARAASDCATKGDCATACAAKAVCETAKEGKCATACGTVAACGTEQKGSCSEDKKGDCATEAACESKGKDASAAACATTLAQKAPATIEVQCCPGH